MRHVNRYKTGGFGTGGGWYPGIRFVAVLQGKANLIDGEIALRTYQYSNISCICSWRFSSSSGYICIWRFSSSRSMSFIQNTRNLGKEVFLLYLFVAMADKLSAGTRGLENSLKLISSLTTGFHAL